MSTEKSPGERTNGLDLSELEAELLTRRFMQTREYLDARTRASGGGIWVDTGGAVIGGPSIEPITRENSHRKVWRAYVKWAKENGYEIPGLEQAEEPQPKKQRGLKAVTAAEDLQGEFYSVNFDGSIDLVVFDGVHVEPVDIRQVKPPRHEEESDTTLEVVMPQGDIGVANAVKQLGVGAVDALLTGLSLLRHRLVSEPTPKEPETAELSPDELPTNEQAYQNYTPPPLT